MKIVRPNKIYKKNHRNILIRGFFIIFFIFISVSFGYYFIILFKSDSAFYSLNLTRANKPVNNILCSPENDKNCVRRAIDGVYVNADWANIYPVAIIIDNHPDARPPASLAKANLVFETEVEAGITRYMAIYAGGEEIEEIGPVRSIRPYFLDWAKEFSALLVHCGGSPEALAKLTDYGELDLNEFYNGSLFWRDKNSVAPHNIFISSANLSEYLTNNKLDKSNYDSWNYKDDAILALRPASAEINISFKISDYLVKWKYDSGKDDYVRYLDGEIHHDKNGRVIRAKNVIIEFVKEKVLDKELRIEIGDIGTGKALVCLDGKCEEAKWQKMKSDDRTKFYKPNGEDIEFNAGTSWLEAVKDENLVNYK